MVNIFSEIESDLIFNEDIVFDEAKIKNYIFRLLMDKINSKNEHEKAFYFEEIIYNFLSMKAYL